MTETTGWYADHAATFGDRVAGAREALGLEQAELARRIGVRTVTLQSWEEDRAEPRANRLQMMAGVLNVSLAWLLTGEGEGLVAPQGAPGGAGELLLELRQLRAQTVRTADRIGVLEKRLKAYLEGDAA
jgi:transcriptional regulator with XRE-family HTH domain